MSEAKLEFLEASKTWWNPNKTEFWQDAGVDLVIDRARGLLPLRHGRGAASSMST